MIKYKVDAVVKVKEYHRRDVHWQRYGYNLKKPYISDDGIIAYRITAGMYIFYISRSVYEQGVEIDIIEPMDDGVEVINFESALRNRGCVCYYRIGYALEHSTLDYLKSEIKRVNSEDKILKIVHYKCNWWKNGEKFKNPVLTYVAEIWVDLENREILKNTADKSLSFKERPFISPFYTVDTYEDLLDRLIWEQDRYFCNSRHIIDRFADNEFFSTDNFLTRQNKYEFTYMKEYSKCDNK